MSFIDRLGENRTLKRFIVYFIDALIVVLAAMCAFLFITWGADVQFLTSYAFWMWLTVNVVLVLLLFTALGMYSMSFSSVGMPEAMRIVVLSAMVGALNIIFVLIVRFFNTQWVVANGFSYTVMGIFAVLLMGFIGLFRFSRRFLRSARRFINSMMRKDEKNVMIIGFNDDAFTLIRNITQNEKSHYKPVCILDMDESCIGKRLGDVRVVGTVHDAKLFARRYNVDEIFVAISSAEKALVRTILQYCKECGCQIKLLPELNELTGGELSVARLRPVDVADLLGREQKKVNLDEIMGYIEHKRVLVTGGGGSIGSELCRQIASHNPAQLIILDIYENNAYDIEQELKSKYPRLNLLTLIASVRDKGKMRDVFSTYRPQIVFNAAAHKHVPLMETSPNEAVKNNVFGTLNVARAAEEFKVDTFVQISTDKAVNPTNIMGATKRICEMIIQTIGKHSEHTNFVAVRFGNVLGSNGSVIPLFKKQIEHGGPVTVTHKDIIRYFMTIPEAVSLVLQAGAYAKSGQIFVLDMGEPVRIYDLAYNLIKMSGLEPNVDIQIVCTGLRPGEKLFEERLMAEEGLQKTANGLISIARPLAIDEDNLWTTLDSLYEAAYTETDSMKEWVKRLVPTYTIDKRNGAKEILEKQAEIAEQETATSAS